MSHITVMVGLSGSGKSTKAQQIAIETGAIVLSSDEIRKHLLGNEEDQSQNGQVFQELYRQLHSALKANKNVIIDATNLTIKSRAIYINFAKQYHATIEAHIVPTDITECIDRDNHRNRTVGTQVIMNQLRKFQIPFQEEGWDNIVIEKSQEEFTYVQCKYILQQNLLTMQNFLQNNAYHKELLGEHIEWTTKEFHKYPYPEEYQLAAKWHDYGKIMKNIMTIKNGISHYYGHENAGCYKLLTMMPIFQTFYPTLQNQDKFLNFLFLVNYHMVPFKIDFLSDKSIHKAELRFQDRLQLLLDFNQCDQIRHYEKEELMDQNEPEK